VKSDNASSNVQLLGCGYDFGVIFNINIRLGSFISEEEEDSGRRVVVLGSSVARNLFNEENPLGKLIKINQSEHRVIGVIRPTGDKLGFNVDDFVFIPNASAMRVFNSYKLFGIRAMAKSKSLVDEAVL